MNTSIGNSSATAPRFIRRFIAPVAMGLLLMSGGMFTHASANSRPNFLMIVADDLGYTDVGFMGGEIRTPRLDALADAGLVFTQFYAAPTCSPTRAMLLTGVDNHLAGLGTMAEQRKAHHQGVPGYEGYLKHNAITLASRLAAEGYQTYMAGKWHLGKAPSQGPDQRGFQQSFALLEGGASHFSDGTGLSQREEKVNYRENGQAVVLPEHFFSSAFFTDKLIGYIERGRGENKPFFAYAAYTAPHWPLHVPENEKQRYKGRYDKGYDKIKAERLERAREKGVIAKTVAAAPRLKGIPAWDTLDKAQQARSARKMELYAAMVENLDRHIGRLMDYLKNTDQLDNTVVVFLSDNGPLGSDVYRVLRNRAWVEENFDNRLDNWGNAGSYIFNSTAWGQVGATPFKLFKGSTAEGGVRVPAFMYAPALDIAPGKTTEMATVLDITPTLLAMAGLSEGANESEFADALPIQGHSLLPILAGGTTPLRVHGWELFGNKAVRQGAWKSLYLKSPSGTGQWALYNLDNDPAEQKDLSAQEPEVLNGLLNQWRDYAEKNRVLELN